MGIVEAVGIFALGALELWAAIPAGMALGLDPPETGILSAAGALCGTAVVACAGKALKEFLDRYAWWRVKINGDSRIVQIWRRYGAPGLGLAAPLVTGAPLGVAIGIALGVPFRKMMVYSILGIVLWSFIITAMCVLGRHGIEQFNPDFN